MEFVCDGEADCVDQNSNGNATIDDEDPNICGKVLSLLVSSLTNLVLKLLMSL